MYGAFVTRADSGIKTVADIKGKRLPDTWKVYPGLQMYMKWLLGFADLTEDDVEWVPESSYASCLAGVIEGRIDVACGAMGAAPLSELDASPHGIHYIP